MKKVLVANRGEIAVRVIRACRDLGLGTVAVHSAADRDSLAVRLADESVQVGPAAARASYLNIPALVEAARIRGADAVHPGYGFLSENPDFAEVCTAEGLTFIGPPAPVIEALGDKARARATAIEAGLPLLPGSRGELADVDAAQSLADEIGYPVIVKAVAGGGGRGMAVVRRSEDLARAWAETRAAAVAVFRDGRLFLERYLDSARHVEVQILADAHGHAVHLGTRDCTLQRRHQKLVEECPAPALPPSFLAEIADAAVRMVQASGYVGAGTVEFLVDPSGPAFFFMEVNCRLQVEHPVTEIATGMDLVAEQLRVAAGEPLGFTQADLVVRGAAVECRINCEDPARGFVPTPGVIERCELPGGAFVRVDTHVHAGYRVPAAYDSLLAKVVVWAPDRERAFARMRGALSEVRIEGPGIATTAGFLRDLLDHPRVVAVEHDTGLIGEVVGA
ncbi:acetyl-CoA carboxylase biotin carboxylase subunit [Actinomycetospora sp. NBRC 106378]|uniref:acetyl-CoA carboxylase biotin carboxylase subunit n=1 Tax=Actinomycetospora sp. NBRC 106378 TaxID=3032208 RepID=UPI0024A58F33|nr:acetyl-CoA carboxylase biotin carboxylase subunit [Actinomycetospora sp. NBRC 106378]GLZ52164.1 acetyl-CoA carboxylase biotin carboxylase subunit [Actinomycetospora sp. NBRC 106378]